MAKLFTKTGKINNINSAKQIIKTKSREIVEKMDKIDDHLEIIKNMDSKDIYPREKSILINLYDYYCEFQKLYLNLSFSEILTPIDIPTIRNMDIKDFVNRLKEFHKIDYDATIEFLKSEDVPSVKKSYDSLENNLDDLVNLLINIQSKIIVNEMSPVDQEILFEKIENIINQKSIFNNLKDIEDDYNKYLDKFDASKEAFK